MTPSLPILRQVPSPNYSSRNGARISKIIAHDCEGSYAGSVSWFAQRASQVSAHIVLSEDGTQATQCVALGDKAWHACNFNPTTIGVEIAGYAHAGFSGAELGADAAIIAWLLHAYGLPCRWAEHGLGDGVCSHYDLGAAGGGHDDITTDPAVWQAFLARVQAAYAAFAAEPLPAWGLHGAPSPLAVSPPPAVPSGWKPSGTVRKEPGEIAAAPIVGSILWVQQRLVALGVNSMLVCDGLNGDETKAAVTAFQREHGLSVDGIAGRQTIAALQAA
jgi:N-acetyl-anhydromuramyl-L-alanine amidase AmpD